MDYIFKEYFDLFQLSLDKIQIHKKNIFLESNSPLLILKAMHRIRVVIVKGLEFFVIP
jgi:hypothetical protein